MIDTGYLYSKDNKRVFVNTCLGCTGKCSYCYLNKMGYDNSSIVGEVRKAEELIKEIEQAGISRDTLNGILLRKEQIRLVKDLIHLKFLKN